MPTSLRASSPSAAPMSIHSSLSLGAILRSSASVRCGGFWPITPTTGPSLVRTRTRCATSTVGTQPPTDENHKYPSSSMYTIARPISSMWPKTAMVGAPSPALT